MLRHGKSSHPQRGTRAPSATQRLISLLERNTDGGLTMTELREQGVEAPGQALYELELAGFQLERVYRRIPSGRATLAYRLNGGDNRSFDLSPPTG